MATQPRSWIDVQKKTFSGWANTFLKERGIRIDDLDTSLQDGVNLIVLVEALSGKQITKYYKNPKTRVQQIENVSIAFQLMQIQEVKLFGIGAPEIVDGNIKLTLGLLWALILRYQISSVTSEGGELPKAALLSWVKGRLRKYDIQVYDFVCSWQDGRALSALVNSLQEGCLAMDTLTQNPLQDAERAMNVANELFHIPKILEAQDLVSFPDELSVMTYLSFFHKFAGVEEKTPEEREAEQKEREEQRIKEEKAKAEQIAEKKARAEKKEAERKAREERQAKEEKAREEAKVAEKRHSMEILAAMKKATKEKAEEQRTAEQRAKDEQRVEQERVLEEKRIAQKKLKEEKREAHQKAAEDKAAEEIRRAEEAKLKEDKKGRKVDVKRVYVHGSRSVYVNQTATFLIHACNFYGQRLKAGGEKFTVRVKNCDGCEVVASISDNVDGTYEAMYEPSTIGNHIVEVLFNEEHIRGSPFTVTVKEQKQSSTIKERPLDIAATPAAEYDTVYFGEITLDTKIDEFEKEFETVSQQTIPNPTEHLSEAPIPVENVQQEVEEIPPEGGSIKLADGAILQALPETSGIGSCLSISIAPAETVQQCNTHDSLEGGTAMAVYNCVPHSEEFQKSVLLKIPYDTTIPVDQLAVFHMKADYNGQPCGTWTMVDAKFTGDTAILLTTHFSYYAVFKFTSATHQHKARLARTTHKYDVLFPGFTYRGKCRNPACSAHHKEVNYSKGFGNFNPDEEVESQQCASCPLCETYFTPTKFILHDTKISATYDARGIPTPIEDNIGPNEAVCYGVGAPKSLKLENFSIKCDPRPGSSYGIDICFVMDCTGSMDPYINEAKTKIKSLAESLRTEVRKMGLECKIRVGFVGYRDYSLSKDNLPVSYDDLLEIAPFTGDLDVIVNKVSEQRAFGGGDACEHVVGGLKEAVNMEWMGSMKVIILVADSPCHGAEFHDDKVGDDFPNGDPSGDHPKTFLLSMLRENINLFFMRITESTDIMINKFRSFYDTRQENLHGRKIEVLDMGQQVTIMSTLIEAGIMRSIARIEGLVHCF